MKTARELAQYIYDNCSNGKFDLGECERVILEHSAQIRLKEAKWWFNNCSTPKAHLQHRLAELQGPPKAAKPTHKFVSPPLESRQDSCELCGNPEIAHAEFGPPELVKESE